MVSFPGCEKNTGAALSFKKQLRYFLFIQLFRFSMRIRLFCQIASVGLSRRLCFWFYAVITVPAFPLIASATKSREVISTLPSGTASR